jgi:hypothetical protein
MRTIITILLGMLLVLAGAALYTGCNQDAKESAVGTAWAPAFDPSAAIPLTVPNVLSAWITSVEPSAESRSISFNIRLVQTDSTVLLRTLSMHLATSQDSSLVFSSDLKGEDGSVQWHMMYSRDLIEPTHSRIEVSTSLRSISVERNVRDSLVSELYTVNGRTIVFSVPESRLQHAIKLYEEGSTSGTFDRNSLSTRSPNDKELITQIERIQRFRTTAGDFDAGPDHTLGISLVSNPQIQHLFKTTPAESGGQPVISGLDWKSLCEGAVLCAYYACSMGPNAVCDVCAVVAAACFIFELFAG